MGSKTLPIISSLYIFFEITGHLMGHFSTFLSSPPCCRERLAGVEGSPHEAQGGGNDLNAAYRKRMTGGVKSVCYGAR